MPTYFVAANKPAATSDADWTKTGKDLETLANGTLRVIAMRPGMDLLQKYTASGNKDAKYCEPAEEALTKALQQFPDAAIIAYNLGRAELCQRQAKPEKIPMAIYEFARAAVIDPSLGGSTDPKAVENYLTTIYTNFHGKDDDGLKQLKDLAAKRRSRRPITSSYRRPRSPGIRKKNSKPSIRSLLSGWGSRASLPIPTVKNTSRDP